MAKKAKPAKGGSSKKKPVTPFSEKLILFGWLVKQFGVGSFEQLAGPLKDQSLEGISAEGEHRFLQAIIGVFPKRSDFVSDESLRRYDENITAITQSLNSARTQEPEIVWKYFQYLMLLFTEIYFDLYFTKRDHLLALLNAEVQAYNEGKDQAHQLPEYSVDQLNKVSFWSATGSGKTWIMHANSLQYLAYAERAGASNLPDRRILLTPNPGLSIQHLGEFEDNGISARLFSPSASIQAGLDPIEVIDIHKLGDGPVTGSGKGVTVPVQHFEGANLVLVDEGHRGTSSGRDGDWLNKREKLCEEGFSIEYSATLGQAVSGNSDLEALYAKNILFDYSYRYFYEDKFGKDYRILNIDESVEEAFREIYLVGALMVFAQQLKIFNEESAALLPFGIEKPLMVFVGSTVTTKERSDIVEVVRFLAKFVNDGGWAEGQIKKVIGDGLVDARGEPIFASSFPALVPNPPTAKEAKRIYGEMLDLVFHAKSKGKLRIDNLIGQEGEVSLAVGDEAPFGVINVGEDSKLVAMCEEHSDELETGSHALKGSLFRGINEDGSPVNMLIGAKKFTEGWSSWRVSTMGLLNVGKGEGSQIIQLFGRGVRLKGHGFKLKRSTAPEVLAEIDPPKHIDLLETLSVFGVHASYMAQFRDFLQREEIKDQSEHIVIDLPVLNTDWPSELPMLRLRKDVAGSSGDTSRAFKLRARLPVLAAPSEIPSELPELSESLKEPITLDWFPKIEAIASAGAASSGDLLEKEATSLTKQHLATLDFEALYADVERVKRERGWSNLTVPRESLRDLFASDAGSRDWYRLLAPESLMGFDSYSNVDQWQKMGSALLQKYVERFYESSKRLWEMAHLEMRPLAEDDPNLRGAGSGSDGGGYYRVTVHRDQDQLVSQLEGLRKGLEEGVFAPTEFGGIELFEMEEHLFRPLVKLNDGVTSVEFTPVSLNAGEKKFVDDLKSYRANNPGLFEDRELYLLRNLSRGKGVGFAEGGGFYPDFIVWVGDGESWRIVFVDPKGVRNLSPSSLKLRFYESIKEIEERVGDKSCTLESFIVSTTPSQEVLDLWEGKTREQLVESHLLFQEDGPGYIERILGIDG
jgi:hypothetical protein